MKRTQRIRAAAIAAAMIVTLAGCQEMALHAGFAFATDPPMAFELSWGSAGTADGEFNLLRGVASDAAGRVWAADQCRLQVFDESGVHQSTYGADGCIQDTVRAVSVDARGNVFFGFSGILTRSDADLGYVGHWGTSNGGSASGQFSGIPGGAGVDASGNMYAADTGNNRVQKFDNAGTYLTEWATNITDLAIGTTDRIFVLTGAAGQEYDTSGATVGGTFGAFSGAQGIAVDSASNIYIADTGNNSVHKYDSARAFVTQWGATGTGDGQFQAPVAVAVNAGEVFVADRDNERVQVFDNGGSFLRAWTVQSITDVAVTAAGEVVATGFTSVLQAMAAAFFDTVGTSIREIQPRAGKLGEIIAISAAPNALHVLDRQSIQVLDSTGAAVRSVPYPFNVVGGQGNNALFSAVSDTQFFAVEPDGGSLSRWDYNGDQQLEVSIDAFAIAYDQGTLYALGRADPLACGTLLVTYDSSGQRLGEVDTVAAVTACPGFDPAYRELSVNDLVYYAGAESGSDVEVIDLQLGPIGRILGASPTDPFSRAIDTALTPTALYVADTTSDANQISKFRFVN